MGETNMTFENHDSRIRYYELLLERSLDRLPRFPLPEGYRFVFYRPGDRDAWIAIEQSAKEFAGYAQGLEAWNRYYGGHEPSLCERMVFIENAGGEKVATATAYYDITGRDPSGSGWLHWVAVRREYQGKGLSKPLIAHVLELMRGLGYTHAKIPTQTTTWLACKIYLDFGFLPLPQNAVHSRNGWRIIKALTNHPALPDFEPAPMEEILASPPAES
ncbi:MAG: GNAT family N-acetyltransferase [Provencibacterium sp.]|jgi:GNAT superfamily N-acetyltransferase|nr:GNAT family N-acetyltransferase [Provencibacterium sp.]